MNNLREISTNTELKEYILGKLAKGGISEKEISPYIFFDDKCNRLASFVYFKEGKYCLSYVGFRKSECFTCAFDAKEELLIQVIKHIASADISTGKSSKNFTEYALELAARIDESAAESMRDMLLL